MKDVASLWGLSGGGRRSRVGKGKVRCYGSFTSFTPQRYS